MSKKLSNDKGIIKLNRKSMTGSMIGEISIKRAVADNDTKRQEDLDGSVNQAVKVPKKFRMTQIIRWKEINGI